MNINVLWALYARAGYIAYFLVWLVFGGIAALWWIPSSLGEPKPIPWQMGSICLALLWLFVFNHWPTLGSKRFFRQRRLKVEVAFLVVLSVCFAAGFAVAA